MQFPKDVPAGATVLLDGFGWQDTHETLNAFIWGPDGWLYGCHGVFTHSKVGKPGTPDAERQGLNAGVWRYHPTRHQFEVFSHGTSNPWGVDFDDNGQAFITACVIPHLWHGIQGARYQRQGGQHADANTYDDIKTIALHRHYLGSTPHGGNGKSDSAGGGHARATGPDGPEGRRGDRGPGARGPAPAPWPPRQAGGAGQGTRGRPHPFLNPTPPQNEGHPHHHPAGRP